ALCLVQFPEIRDVFESAIFTYSLRPRDIHRSRNMSSTLSMFIRILWRRRDLAGEFLGAPDVHKYGTWFPIDFENVSEVGSQLLVWLWYSIFGGLIAWDVLGQWPVFIYPFLPSIVDVLLNPLCINKSFWFCVTHFLFEPGV